MHPYDQKLKCLKLRRLKDKRQKLAVIVFDKEFLIKLKDTQ